MILERGMSVIVSEKLTEGLPVRILLETTIEQEGEVSQHAFDEMGRIVLMNDNYYLRYKESVENEEGITTLIKISEDEVQLTRHGEPKTRLKFNGEEDTYSIYPTPQGNMEMRVSTHHMSISYNEQPFAGEVDIDYVIYVSDLPLGTYQMRLRFTT